MIFTPSKKADAEMVPLKIYPRRNGTPI